MQYGPGSHCFIRILLFTYRYDLHQWFPIYLRIMEAGLSYAQMILNIPETYDQSSLL